MVKGGLELFLVGWGEDSVEGLFLLGWGKISLEEMGDWGQDTPLEESLGSIVELLLSLAKIEDASLEGGLVSSEI